MMSIRGFPTKKALKDRVKVGPLDSGVLVETSMFGPQNKDGVHAIVGPSEYERRWYAQVTISDGQITRVS